MKISLLPISFYEAVEKDEMTVMDWVKFASRIKDLDAFDVGIAMLKSRTPKYLEELRREIEKCGKPLNMVTTYPDYSNPDPVQRKREKLYSQADIAVASELGASYVRVLAGQKYPGTKRKENVKRAVEGLLQANETAKQYGVQLVYENHPGCMAWEYPDVSTDPEAVEEILAALKGSGIGFNLDTANAVTCGLDPVELLKKYYCQVTTFHITDFTYDKNGNCCAATIGTGKAPNREVIAYAEAQGFSGWYCIEECSGRGLSGMVDAVDFVREVETAVK